MEIARLEGEVTSRIPDHTTIINSIQKVTHEMRGKPEKQLIIQQEKDRQHALTKLSDYEKELLGL